MKHTPVLVKQHYRYDVVKPDHKPAESEGAAILPLIILASALIGLAMVYPQIIAALGGMGAAGIALYKKRPVTVVQVHKAPEPPVVAPHAPLVPRRGPGRPPKIKVNDYQLGEMRV